jgi:hypothetical protein
MAAASRLPPRGARSAHGARNVAVSTPINLPYCEGILVLIKGTVAYIWE